MQMPGEALLLKMWETLVEKGIGGLITSLLTPWHDKRLALSRIEIDKACKIATFKAEQEIDQITNSETKLIGFSEIASEENESDVSVKDIVLNNDMKRLIREEINVSKAINYANERLIEDDSNLPQEDISQDWLNTWRDNASKVSDEEVQSLWGNVLAQEFLEPGRYSLRLLAFLKTMAKSDALLIEKVAPFISKIGLIHKRGDIEATSEKGNNLLTTFDILESELYYLEEIGIISGISVLGKFCELSNVNEEKNGLLSFIGINSEMVIAISSEDSNKSITYDFYTVTKVGREIFSLINFEVNYEYIVWLGSQFADDFKVEICKSVDDGWQVETVL